MSTLADRLKQSLRGDVLFDAWSRGRYATDASIYQIDPIGVVVPRDDDDALTALEIAAECGVPVLPRGAGSSQCGQTVGEALVVDVSRHLCGIHELDTEARTVWVEPGVVLDQLNAALRPHGLWFPVDVSTSAQATLGGMAGNNSCGARSLRYGNMVHNVFAIDVWLSGGERLRFAPVEQRDAGIGEPRRYRELVAFVRNQYRLEHDEIVAKVPAVQRRVAGYNLDMVSEGAFNMAHLLVGSEGTLAYSRRIGLQLAPLPEHVVLGVVHFPRFQLAMEAAGPIVTLAPDAVELVDRTMIELSRRIDAFRSVVDAAIPGDPDAVLLVEFSGTDARQLDRKLRDLATLMADLGLPGSVVAIPDRSRQKAVWEFRKAGLNIMMSMKGDGKPVSFIEDCAVPLQHLPEYTARLMEIFARHGTRGTFYAHASVGCLHVRPVLDMRESEDVSRMRSIAEQVCALVRELKGSYSGEHGDGLVRSEWIAPMYGARLADAFARIKRAFDPHGLMNPGKIVAAPKMDERLLFRYRPGYATIPLAPALDWSEHEVGERNVGRGFAAAVEMCNNNGYCRKIDAGTLCPSYQVTRDERDVTRGRANSLRLALSGQLGDDAITSEEMHRTMALCVSCKACRRECPTGVDMARMKIEFLHHFHEHHPRTRFDRLVAQLPFYAPVAARFAPIVNLRNRVPGLRWLTGQLLGIAPQRSLPAFRRDWFRGADEVDPAETAQGCSDREVLLMPDTFNRYFEPENLRAAVRVLSASGYRIRVVASDDGSPVCCGRTLLAAGMVDEARAAAGRLIAVTRSAIARGLPLVGLEPACVLGLRDEYRALLPGGDTEALAGAALTFGEFVQRERKAGRFLHDLSGYTGPRRAVLHGHCHEKSFGVAGAVADALAVIPGMQVDTIASGCCGMAGGFGYDRRYFDVSMRMGENTLLPAVRGADARTLIVADGTSCRQQIRDGTGRNARHSATVLADAIAPRPRSG